MFYKIIFCLTNYILYIFRSFDLCYVVVVCLYWDTDKYMMTSTNKYERDLVSHQSTQQRRSNRVGCYEIIKTIGKGNFATVKLASHIYTKEKVY